MATAILAVAVVSTSAVRAKVKIEGTRDALHVATDNDTVANVLAALGAAYPIAVEASAPLDAPAREQVSGSLPQVLSALLDGYDYAIWIERDLTKVVVSGRSGKRPVPPAPPPPRPNITQKWR